MGKKAYLSAYLSERTSPCNCLEVETSLRATVPRVLHTQLISTTPFSCPLASLGMDGQMALGYSVRLAEESDYLYARPRVGGKASTVNPSSLGAIYHMAHIASADGLCCASRKRLARERRRCRADVACQCSSNDRFLSWTDLHSNAVWCKTDALLPLFTSSQNLEYCPAIGITKRFLFISSYTLIYLVYSRCGAHSGENPSSLVNRQHKLVSPMAVCTLCCKITGFVAGYTAVALISSSKGN